VPNAESMVVWGSWGGGGGGGYRCKHKAVHTAVALGTVLLIEASLGSPGQRETTIGASLL
jgi:hypothetical protein